MGRAPTKKTSSWRKKNPCPTVLALEENPGRSVSQPVPTALYGIPQQCCGNGKARQRPWIYPAHLSSLLPTGEGETTPKDPMAHLFAGVRLLRGVRRGKQRD